MISLQLNNCQSTESQLVTRFSRCQLGDQHDVVTAASEFWKPVVGNSAAVLNS